MFDFSIIVAFCKKRGIGNKNKLSWNLPQELKHFKEITISKADTSLINMVIMGRKTWESIPEKFKPLKNRINVIITSREINNDLDNSIYYFKSLDEALSYDYQLPINPNGVFIIGGTMLYLEALKNDHCKKLYITEIYKDFECDVYFPEFKEEFNLISVSNFQEDNGVYFRYLEYSKIGDLIWKNLEEMQYINMLQEILYKGIERNDRTNVGTLSVFGKSFNYDLSDTFPILTSKRVFFRAVFEELMLYLRGETNNNLLNDKKIHIWDGNTSREFLDKRGLINYQKGDMGETYGFNFRHYGGDYQGFDKNYDNQGFDQLAYIIDLIKNNPTSRRIMINLWNPKTLHKAALPRCLCQYQFYVDTESNKLNLQIYIRSSDFFLANNWNTCTGALFVHLLCNLEGINLTPGNLTVVTGDTHIYLTHLEQVKENLKREPKLFPKLIVKKNLSNIEDYKYEDIELIGYYPEPNIKVEMAV